MLNTSEYLVLRRELAELRAEASATSVAANRAKSKARLHCCQRGHSTVVPTACNTHLTVWWCSNLRRHCRPLHAFHALQWEGAAIRAAVADSDARERELQSQLEKATSSLRDQIEKAAKARRQHERCVALQFNARLAAWRVSLAANHSTTTQPTHPRPRTGTPLSDKKVLQAKADELRALMEQRHQEHQDALRAAAAAHAEELKTARLAVAADARSVLEAQLSRLSAEASAQEGHLVEQHAHELAAARSEAMQQLAALQEELSQLRLRCSQLERQARQGADAVARERGRAGEWQQAAAAAEARAQQAERDAAAARAELAAAAKEAGSHAARLQQLEREKEEAAVSATAASEAGAAELQAVQSRFLALLQKKDTTISALQGQLAELDAAL